MESEKFSTSGLYWLCKEAEHRSSAADSPVPEVAVTEIPDLQVPVVEKRRRGRPPKGEAEKKKRKLNNKEDEDVCFICFDGGTLVLCDRGDCPKAYHPACIKRDEAFFQTDAKWTCGWHICSKCQKSVSRYMCFTCTYSLCKGCTKDADYLSVRGNKGFCSTCYRVVMMIENIGQGNKETVQVDFDDKLSWEYLFKVYWICLKQDLSLTVDEITRAQKPWTVPSKVTRREKPSAVNYSGNNGTMASENPTIPVISNTSKKLVSGVNNTSAVTTTWASKELLDFVAYTRNGDTSVLSQKETQALLFDYIKRNNLRDPHQRSEIICDSKLENLFRKPRVRHFEMLSLLEFHFLKKESQRDEVENDIIEPAVRQATGESNSDNLQMISENSIYKVERKDEERVDVNMVNEGKEACEKLESRVDSSGSINNGVISKSLSGVKSETPVASLSTGSTPSTNDKETENSWHYRDPTGKVQGPFSIEHFHKWSSAGTLPPDMQIWGLNTEERDSLRLVDVIKGQSPLQNNLSLSPQEVKNTSDSTSHHCDGSANSAGIDTDAQSNGKVKFAKGKETVPHSSNSTTPITNNDAKMENSSKHRDPPEVISSYSNHPQVQGLYIFNEKPHEPSVDEKPSNVEQTRSPSQNNENLSSQGNMVSQTTGGQCQENQINEQRYFGQPSDEPFCQNSSVNYLNSHESPPQYASMANPTDDSEQKSSINLQDIAMTMPKTSTGELQAQPIKAKRKSSKKKREKVNNDAKMENSSKCWEPSGVITSYPNHLQVQQISTFTEKPQESSVDKNRSNLGKNWSSTPDNEKLSSQGTLVSQTIGRQCHENQINEQHYLGRLSSDGPLCENSSVNNGNIHTSHPQYTSMANSTNASEQKFSINLEDMPMIMPKTRTGELQPQTVKPKRKSSKTRMEKVKGKGKEGENSWHYRDPSGKVQGPFAFTQLHKWSSTGTFPPDMRIWRLNTEERDSVLLVDVIRGQTLLQNNLSLFPQEVKVDRLLSSRVNSAGTDADAHSNCKLEFATGYEPIINNDPQVNNDAKIENSSKSLAPAPPKVINSCSNQPQVHFTEKPHETFVHESRRDVGQTRSSTPNYEINVQHGNMMSQTTSRHGQGTQLNEHYYLDRPSEDQNSSVNNWNSHKFHPHNTSTSNPTDVSEQKFSIHLQDSPMSMPKPSTGGLQPQTIKPIASSTDASQEKFSINLQDFPMPMPKTSTAELQSHTVKEQWWDPPLDTVQSLSTQNVLSLTTKSIDHGEKDYPQKKMTSLTPEYEKIQATENSSNFFLGGGTHLHKQPTKPSMEEWDSCFLSVSSLRPQETVNNHMTTLTSKCDEFPPPSPPNPVPNASSWLAMVTEPIEFNTLAEESVSDLLAEVDAMESNSDLASPNLLMDYADDLFHDSKTDCFSSLRGLSFPLDQGKNDALNSSGDINMMLPPQSIMREEPILAHSHNVLDPFKKPRKHSSTSSVLEIETKNQFEFRSNRPNSSPKKKTRDLADIMNGPPKHGNSKSPGSTRRESDQGTPRGSGSKNRSTSGGRESHQKHGGERLTSPRERTLSSGGERLTSPRDRNVPGGDLGFSKGRPSWSRQSSFGSGSGSGGHSRTVPRGQRVCKFYENGYCRKGAFCDYLHP